jgi:predicted signal transduction protein with EAL and GGDEF domain
LGDLLLKQVAAWLTQAVGDANLVARVDADHFGVVLPNIKQARDTIPFLRKTMLAFLSHPFRLNDAVFRIAAKVGVAVYPDDGTDADTLFRNAESALKKAKLSGDKYLSYSQNMTVSVAGRLSLENQLRQALERKEFALFYQPKMNILSGEITGAEALLRWNDPLTGLVSPNRFIPILEDTGLMHDVGRWALNEAVQTYRRWCSARLKAVPIAVNVSPMQLRNRGFVAEIRKAIGPNSQAASGLELEITESLIMEDVRISIASLRAIRELGVRIAIDDFGTGFSSLSYLARLPVHTLKIDRSFVSDMVAGPEGLALVSTIINLARSMKLNVVAEGVETDEQSRLLRLLNCDEIQGYWLGHPVARDVFEAKYLGITALNEDLQPRKGSPQGPVPLPATSPDPD